MQSIKKFIEKKLKLKVNEEKSKAAKSDRVKFLGMTIVKGLVAISKIAFNKAMEKVKLLIPRRSHLPIEKTIERFSVWYRGWAAYFGMTQFPSQLKALEAHARRRLRARLAVQQKRPRFLVRKLVKMGVSLKRAKVTVYSNKGPWRISHTGALE
ncbi:MAG: group II intron maturase-specific domain-containing protein, partial [Acidimicrobiia bacterium]